MLINMENRLVDAIDRGGVGEMGEGVKRYRLPVHNKCYGDIMYTVVIKVNNTPITYFESY